MKPFHPLSFTLGLASGLVVLVIVVGSWQLASPSTGAPRMNGTFQQTGGIGGPGGAGPNTARMAERLGMTEAELQEALDSGKTMQQIAEERGVEMPTRTGTGGMMGRGLRGASSSAAASQSGASLTSSSSSPQS